MAFDFEEALKKIPHSPGIYIMRDLHENIFYVGKAKDLHKRIRQYSSAHDDRAFVSLLDDLLGKIDVVITQSEKEALILEATYIRREKPRFNILLKDDKAMLQLRLDLREPWPRVEIVRKRKKDGAKYFGPYPSAVSCRRSLNALNRYFMLRTCKDSAFNNRSRPCLQYEIRRCLGPCVFPVEREEYLQRCKEAALFLSGKYETLLGLLEEKMFAASQRMAFELAANYRDQIQAIKSIGEEQKIVQKSPIDQDYIALYHENTQYCLAIAMVRDGRLVHLEHYETESKIENKVDLSLQIIVQHYQRWMNFPREVILQSYLANEIPLIEETLTELAQKRVCAIVPKRGTRLNLLQTASANAEQQFRETFLFSNKQILDKLQNSLALKRYPRRIECYDISNLQAGAIVGAMTVFMDGKLDASRCRTFKIRDSLGQNDFLSLYEILTRRMRYLKEPVNFDDLAETASIDSEFEDKAITNAKLDKKSEKQRASFQEYPDLIVIDGGKGQVNAALKAIRESGISHDFDVIGIGEARSNSNQALNTKIPDRIFLPNRSTAIIFPQESEEMLLLIRLRDETHRRAVNFHRKNRDSMSLRSKMDLVPGIGPKRKALLLKTFGSPKEIAAQSPETLMKVAKIREDTALRLIDTLQEDS